jgi:hypothetical protein
MIKNNFKIDFERKNISYVGSGEKTYGVKELYSFLMDLFDEPENMKYDIPIVAKSETEFKLINGWFVDKKSLKFIEGRLD